MSAARHTYLLIHPDGRLERVISEGPLALERMQALVGGHIEHVLMGPLLAAMVNEEGLLLELPRNRVFRCIAGPVVLGRDEGEEFAGLPEEQLALLEQAYGPDFTREEPNQ